MLLYRITQRKFAATPFDPIGAKRFGGRWNSKGVEALYFSSSEALCILEVLVHARNVSGILEEYDLFSITIPDELIVCLSDEDLPKTWRAIPPNYETQQIGDEFLGGSAFDYAAIQVPSVIAPREKNYLVNPNHKSMPEIFDNSVKLDVIFDTRLFK